jgi:hypothetical protein
VNKRFGLPLTDNLIGKIALLQHDDSVNDFIKRFMASSCRDMAITDDFIKRFIGKPLRTDVTLHQPPTLDDAIMLARAYEQRETVSSPPAPRQHSSWRARTNPTGSAIGAAPAASAASSPSMAKPASSVKQLTPVKVAQRHKDGQCFHCNEFFTNEHKEVCKQLFCIEVIEDDDTPTDDTDMPVISIHTLTDIHPRAGHTM